MYRLRKSVRTFAIVLLVITVIWFYTYLYDHVLQTNHSEDIEETSNGRILGKEIKNLKFLDIENALKKGNRGNHIGGRGASNGTSSEGYNGADDGAAGGGEPETYSLLTPEEIEVVNKTITRLNAQQKIYNLEKFGPVDGNTYVLVVQVHSRVEYLALLVDSLSRMQGIENSLIIFSHDLYVPALNEAIQRNIDFTRVMQIFYPHSIQLNPKRFPGQSPDDCPRNISTTMARKIKCRNADHPDYHGHYREASYTQTKHHWWWKANFVFDKLECLRNYSGVIAFLEEDHYVTPDFLWMLNLMETEMIKNRCHGCNLLSLGTYTGTWNMRPPPSSQLPWILWLISYLYPMKMDTNSIWVKNNGSEVVATNWISTKHNMGLCFNKTLWEKMKHCASTFCEYDDYNWDWSLLRLSYTCLSERLHVLYAKEPRIFHVGDCGVHHKGKRCDPGEATRGIEKVLKQYNSSLFPDKLTMEHRREEGVYQWRNGGWGDPRDWQLCMSFVEL